MVERLFIHNYKGFVNFEMRFGRIVLLVGRNGTGKSSLVDVLGWLASNVILNGDLNDFPPRDRFRLGDDPTQKFEIDVRLEGRVFTYSIEFSFDGQRPRVIREKLVADSQRLLRRDGNGLFLYDSDGIPGWEEVRSGTVPKVPAGPLIDQFRSWARGLCALRLRPRTVNDYDREGPGLTKTGETFVGWYQYVSSRDPEASQEFLRAIRGAIPGLQSLRLKPMREGKLLEAEFGGKGDGFRLAQLSEGEVSLIVLYAVLHFCVRRSMTVALDEPDNYLGLAEIEPFLHALEDAVDENQGQVFLVSHHPEIYNRWASDPERCRHLIRTEDGRFVAQPINWDEHSGLMPADVVARGWEDA
jgi:energy-coupling factor transporter ATP-binding protein EcfA2